MSIAFNWGDTTLTPEQKSEMEKNIRKEMPTLEGLSNYDDDLTVYLFENPFFPSLEGTAMTASDEVIAKVTSRLPHLSDRDYFYLGRSCKDES